MRNPSTGSGTVSTGSGTVSTGSGTVATRAVATRWLGVGLASSLAVVTIYLAATGNLALYISPSSNWFAISMSVLLLIGAVASFLVPLGAEAHGHDHHGHDHGDHDGHDHGEAPEPLPARAAAVAGGIVASGVVLSILVLPPASLSPAAAATRSTGAAPLFAGADAITLATSGDTSEFGVGDWASVFATATDPGAFEGDEVTLEGFVGAPEDGAFDLTRLVISHCVIDAQVATLPVAAPELPDEGGWVRVTGTVRSAADGTLEIVASDVESITEPQDPYEY